MVRYGFTWNLQTLTGGGVDANNDPIPQIATWTPFICDAQLQTGRFVVNGLGDKINITYSVYVSDKELTFLKGATVKDHNNVERVILGTEYNYFMV